ncbi:MAG: enoyl-CoA hydratase/isomerase family protein [Actinobacteria bacterium]|nr:enoyl-CoA hydratase/isomerase family protein [Actinomycetota bacterium]MCB9389545.1 enoyl-CoA hydratase/isomerase family protein [Acidimicrobiia bacterium]
MTDERSLDEIIRYNVNDGVATITIDRPEARNALTPDQRNRLIDLFQQVSADLNVRAVILAGTDKSFCTGADLRARQPKNPRPDDAPDRAVGEPTRMIAMGAQRLIAAVMDCEKPVVAAVSGVAAGIGAHLAFASDIVVIGESTRFIEVFVRRGIMPDGGGTYLLPRLVGPLKAKELMFFGDDIDADTAISLGLANSQVTDEEVLSEAQRFADRLATLPTRALAYTKRLVNHSFESDRQRAFDEEATAQELVVSTVDAQEGIKSFVEGRKPVFRGF